MDATNHHTVEGVSRAWKVGELAQRTGLSVRTLRSYDEIGLLSPSCVRRRATVSIPRATQHGCSASSRSEL